VDNSWDGFTFQNETRTIAAEAAREEFADWRLLLR